MSNRGKDKEKEKARIQNLMHTFDKLEFDEDKDYKTLYYTISKFTLFLASVSVFNILYSP